MVSLAEAERLAEDGPEGLDAALLPVDRALAGWEEASLSADEADRFLHGQAISSTPADAGMVRVYGPQARFLGVAERDPRGELSPRRVFHL